MERSSSDKFVEIFPHMENILQCGVFSYNSSTEVTAWSDGIYNILGVQPQSISSNIENLLPFVATEDRERVIGIIRDARKNKTTFKIEFTIVDAKGIQKRVHSENFYRNDASGNLYYEGILKDITENYFYKQALEQKVHQLDKSNQNLQEFVYIASHDLQEPLRKISTFVGRLKSRFENILGEEGQMYIGRVLNSTNNMQTLLEDLLSFSRLSFTDKEYEDVDLQNCINSVISDLEVKIEETKTKIICDTLPEVQGYASQLKQLFGNLLNNAIKFRKPDVPPLIKIEAQVTSAEKETVSLEKNKQYVKVHVIDNGIGFENEFAEKVFMIFQRLNGKSEYAGSGVGLSICKRITENHHGLIFAESEPGKGSQFTVLLPLKQS